ncbi:MAG: hypothetical protein VKK04_21110 [Synechococcales bacterium]|nr:hypothetical protein [Synechococcales bacterium]
MSKSLLKATPADTHTELYNFINALPPMSLADSRLGHAIDSADMADLATQLEGFIQRSLQQSYSATYSADERLKILDYGWKAQKLRWDIRRIWSI